MTDYSKMTLDELMAESAEIEQARQELRTRAEQVAAMRAARLREEHAAVKAERMKLTPEMLAAINAKAQRVGILPMTSSAAASNASVK